MIFYVVNGIDYAIEGEVAYETLAGAMADVPAGAEIRKLDTGPLTGRRLLCAVFNREGFAAKQEVVYKKPMKQADPC